MPRVVYQVCCPSAHRGMPAARISSRNSCVRPADGHPWRKARIATKRLIGYAFFPQRLALQRGLLPGRGLHVELHQAIGP